MDAEPFVGVLLLRAQVEPLPQSQRGSPGSQAAACTSGSLPDNLGDITHLALLAFQAMRAQLPLLSGPSPTWGERPGGISALAGLQAAHRQPCQAGQGGRAF